jgi:tetratricopeptide (TPR) repeat protein
MKVRYIVALVVVWALIPIWTGCSNYAQQARVYESLGDYNSAVLAYQKMVEKYDGVQKAYAMANLGRIKLKLGQNWEAEELLRKAKKQLDRNDPIYPEVCFNLGYCYYLRGEQWYNQAIAEMNEAVRVKEDLPKAHYYLGAMYFRTKQYQKALSHLPRIKGENEDKALYISGLCYWRLGEPGDAERNLRRAVELAKNRTDKKQYMDSLQDLLNEIAQLERTKYKIGKPKLNPIFLAFPAYYAENPLGEVPVINRLEEAIKDVRLLVEIKGFSSTPTPNPVGDLKPGQRVTVPIKAVIDAEKAKNQMENILNQEVVITLEYTLRGSKFYERRIGYTKLYNVHAMNWKPVEQIGAFVAHENPAVAKIARHASRADTPLEKAIQIYDTLKLYGITYSRDPQNPFSRELDYLLYPWETLEQKSGDCDDLSVLYAACLQNVGIETGFLLSKDHIFVTFNTRLLEDRAKVVIPDKNLYQIRDGFAWVPVEVTMLGDEDKSFFEAWLKGADEYSEELEFVRLFEAWEKFKPVWVGRDLDLNLPDRNAVSKLYNDDVEKAKNRWKNVLDDDIKYQLERLAKGERGEAEVRNLVGINYVLKGEYQKAKKELERATLLEPSVGKYHNNLANVLFLLGDHEGAMKEYQIAIQNGASKGGVYYNMAICYYGIGEVEKADQIKEMAENSNDSRDDFLKVARAYASGASTSFGDTSSMTTAVAQAKVDLKSRFKPEGEGTRASGISEPEDLEWLLYWMK